MDISIFQTFHYTVIIPISYHPFITYHIKHEIPAEWQMILMNEGSFTQNLNYLHNQTIFIDMQQKSYQKVTNNHLTTLRCVWLENSIYTKLTFARSLWKMIPQNNLSYKLKQSKPIGNLLIANQSDIYKNIIEIYYGYCINLEKSFDNNLAIWGRKYVLYYNHNTYAIIQEFFSPNISSFFN